MDREANTGKEKGGRITVQRLVALLLLTAAVTAAIALGVTALLVNIFEHKQEARNPFFRVVELTDETVDPAVWGKNFPQQYDGYQRTTDQKRTRFGGSEALPHTPTQADPRSVVAQSRLEEDPRLVTMWAGYAFAKDFREERGHAWMLLDQLYTERQHVSKQPGACIHCHASVYVPYKKLGDGDLIKGFHIANRTPYAETRAKMEEIMKGMHDKLHPIACIDCHDPKTMQLRVTRPGFLEGIQALAASDAGITSAVLPSVARWREGDRKKPYDPNTDASRQEMRSFVCGQCHVEYYFKGPEKQLTYPWFNGLKADQVLAYYDKEGFKDWEHAETGAPVLKAQHPEFEMWNQGVHARSGVACADCHMPYQRVGALKISDHHVNSPLLKINTACQGCHKFPEEELKARAEQIQERTFEMRNLAMNALMDLISQLKRARQSGAPAAKIAEAQNLQRKAQFLLDYVEAENSSGFHAPQEAARLMTNSVNYARRGLMVLADQASSTATLTNPVATPKPL